MTKTHWLQNPNKNYLGHQDLPNGEPVILKIKSAKWEEVKNPITNSSEAKRVVRFEEDVKPFICNEINASSIIKSIGCKFMEDSVGFVIELRVDQTKVMGQTVDCLRVNDKKVVKNKKETLDENHPKWKTAKENVKNGLIDLEGLRKHWCVSDENFLKLQE